jgi:UDP-GlcNAc:undecaprenyl-phosphate/decaprenyl-phosphate GlcNAc-1-phosphate transferase
MVKLIFLGLSAFLVALAITPIVAAVSRRLGFLDRPDEVRKLHKHPVPRVGGISIVLSYVSAFLLLSAVSMAGFIPPYFPHLALAKELLPAAVTLFLTGLFDDIVGLKPWQKLGGQILAASLAYSAGIRILSIADHSSEWWSLPLTVLWLVGCTNAFNLIDGIDGLAAGVGFLSTLTVVLAALMQNNVALAVATIPLSGALLGFLRYNFNPASIFLGDCGSLLIGFLLGCYGVVWTQKCATVLGMLAPVMALALPVTDVALAVIRRFLREQPLFSGDRGHIHHKLLAMGFKPKGVALILYGVCAIAATLSLVQASIYKSFGGPIVLLFCLLVWSGVAHLRYQEFGVMQEMFVRGEFRQLIKARIRLGLLKASLANVLAAEDCWLAVRDACKDLGYSGVALKLRDITHEELFHREPANTWSVTIALSQEEEISIRYPLSAPVPAITVVPLMELLREQFLIQCARQTPSLGEPAQSAEELMV